MIVADPLSRLPDPDYHAEFYRDVPMKRLIAWFIDSVLIALVVLLIVPFTAFVALFFLPMVFLAVSFMYRWVTLTSGSATWGMRLMAIEFRRHDGARFDALTALLHTLGFTVSISMVIPQLISIALMVTGARAQGLSDMALGTVALNRAAQR
ncbi:RDD family protein [mine drainage metagenome]|uniref:RDD family protein n=1 Tax=mine drainage metagenome TaxID=410659 RepID=A0A1J5PSY3_9ZZZZ